MKKPILFALALVATACLEGDYNPYAEPRGGSASTTAPTAITPGTACSQSTNVPVNLSFQNRSPYTLRVYWVDYRCQEVDYGTLAPAGTFESNTSATHPWRLREASSNNLVFEYVTGTSPTQSVDVQVR